MKSEQDQYPIFEANQVLSNRHLNDVFNYLDEQDRLTRANLIGIGIVCGLEIEAEDAPAVIRLSRGCGITSEGYLIVEPDDVELVSYRPYSPPNEVAYPPFEGYPLWELFPAGEPNTDLLGQPSGFLDDKAVLLFLELKKASLRNCSPNNCDDKGSAVTVTTRRLLMSRDDLAEVIAAASGFETGLTVADIEQLLTARFNLPDLHLPVYNVPATTLLTSQQVLSAFQAVFTSSGLAAKTHAALSSAYQAFKPIVGSHYPADPFSGFDAKFGFLNTLPNASAQVRFLQYYYDCFADLLAAYNEFRWQAAELVCLCCPPAGLFPRHLLLGLLLPETAGEPGVFRNRFLPSPAVSGCTEQVRALNLLFSRLVALIERFTNNPPLPDDAEQHIKITPSRLGSAPLSGKAIPYYYLQNGDPPLYLLWSPEQTRRGRAAQNLSYRAYEYQNKDFVLEPLRFDLEPCNFLRIEGHLGKPYQQVLNNLLMQKQRYRLPVEIIALRTGEFDETGDVDLSKEACYFDDLITLYKAYQREIVCATSKARTALFKIKIDRESSAVRVRPAAELNNDAQTGTLGAFFTEKYQGRDFCDLVDIGEPPLMNAAIRSVGFFYQFELLMPENLAELDWQALDHQITGFRQWTAEISKQQESADQIGELDWKAIDAVVTSMIDQCQWEALKLIVEELIRRVREVRKKRFLSYFLQKHPGIRHKAGVPLGGTFILVYHEPAGTNTGRLVSTVAGQPVFTRDQALSFELALSQAQNRLKNEAAMAANRDVQIVLEGLARRPPLGMDIAAPVQIKTLFDLTVAQLPDGAVIADFYLPYLCCSDCAPVQFVLPKSPPTFDMEIGCTNLNNQAEVSIQAQGGNPPYRIQIDGQGFEPFEDKPLLLNAGAHTVRIKDADETESAAKEFIVAQPLRLEESSFKCTDNNTYISVIKINGGTPPYRVNGNDLDGDVFVAEPVASGSSLAVEAVDSHNCDAGTEVMHVCEEPCGLPCDGQSRRCAYRLWVQPPQREAPYEVFDIESDFIRFRFNGKDFEIPVEEVFSGFTASNLNGDFGNTVGGALKILNELINKVLVEALGEEGDSRLVLSYDPAETEPFAIFRIEYFVCETFSLEFGYRYAQPSPGFGVTVRYTNEPSADGNTFNGFILFDRERENETRIPAFDCSERNQCSGTDYKPLCEGPALTPVIEFEPIADNRIVFFGSVDNPVIQIAAWVWSFPGALTVEPVYTGEKPEVQFERLLRSAQLTVITADGCFYSAVRTITLQ